MTDYQWDVGADGTVEGRDPRLTTVLHSAGVRPVRLTVRDAYGAGASMRVSRSPAGHSGPPGAPLGGGWPGAGR